MTQLTDGGDGGPRGGGIDHGSGERIATTALLDAVTRVHGLYYRDGDRAALFGTMLEALLDLTDSEYGYIGEVLIDDAGNPYQVTWAIADDAWDAEIRGLFGSCLAPEDALVVTSRDILFARVLIEAVPVVANSPEDMAYGRGLPAGHPPLDAYLGIPLWRGDTMVGSVGLANRPGGYRPSDVDDLEPLLSLCALLIDAIRTDRERAEARAAEDRALQEMRREHHLALLGRLAGGVAHDVKNLVSAITLQCDLLEVSDSAVSERAMADHNRGIGRIRDVCDSVTAMAARLNEVWSGRAGAPTCDPGSTVLGYRALMRSLVAPGVQLAVEVTDGADGSVALAASEVFQVISNLLVNANEALIAAGQSRGRVVVTVGAGAPMADGRSTVRISVADDGPGVAESVRDEVFSAAVSTKGVGRGLGLATVVGLTESAGGSVRLLQPPMGTCVEVTLPVVTG